MNFHSGLYTDEKDLYKQLFAVYREESSRVFNKKKYNNISF